MKPHWFQILLALSDRDRHGSGIVREVRRATDGDVRLWPVTLYRSLDELMERDWVEELTDPEERPPGTSAKRRYFRLTAEGRSALSEEAERLLAMGRQARRKLAAS